MTSKFIVFIGFTFSFSTVFSQTKVDSLLSVGNKLYKNKQFDKAASIWETAASLTEKVQQIYSPNTDCRSFSARWQKKR